MIIDELIRNVHNNNSNLHFDNLPRNVQVWIEALCYLVEQKLDNIEERIDHDINKERF